MTSVDTEVSPISRKGIQMMSELYELTSLACPMLGTSDVAKAAREWVAAPDATGTLLGCWRTEFSTLGRLLILRSFDSPDALHQERRRALLSANPFNAGRLITTLEMASYQRFPFLPPARPAKSPCRMRSTRPTTMP